MNIRKVCVLGGSGFVGIHLVNKLVVAGYSVRVPTRRREHAKTVAVLPDVEVVEANIFDPVDLDRHFAGMDAVINLVGILNESGAGQGSFHEVHVELPRKIVQACAASGVKRLLHMSALNASTAAPSAYLRSKGEGEAVVLEAGVPHGKNENLSCDDPGFVRGNGLEVTTFRPSVIFGREDSFLNKFAGLLKIAPVLPLASPQARFQPVFVEDVAQAFVASLGNPATFGQSYDLCGPKAYTLRELVSLVGVMTGHRRRIIGLSPRLSYLQAWFLECLPGRKIMTRDNYYTMQVDSVCSAGFPSIFGLKPSAIEAVAPAYLVEASPYQAYRSAAGR
jgi:NADH dehydrogenase